PDRRRGLSPPAGALGLDGAPDLPPAPARPREARRAHPPATRRAPPPTHGRALPSPRPPAAAAHPPLDRAGPPHPHTPPPRSAAAGGAGAAGAAPGPLRRAPHRGEGFLDAAARGHPAARPQDRHFADHRRAGPARRDTDLHPVESAAGPRAGGRIPEGHAPLL